MATNDEKTCEAPPKKGYTIEFIPTEAGDCRICSNISQEDIAGWKERYIANPRALSYTQTLFLLTLLSLWNISDTIDDANNSGGMLA